MIESLRTYFGEAHNRRRIERLAAQVRVRDAEKPRADSPIAGKTVVFTGTLEKMIATGEGLRRALRRQGLGLGVDEDRLCRRRPKAGSKLAEAKKFGVAILTEDEWARLIR